MSDSGPDIPLTLEELRRLPGARMSPRQRIVCLLIFQGKTNREIEQEMGISTASLIHHSREIMRKTQTRNRVQLVKRLAVLHFRGR